MVTYTTTDLVAGIQRVAHVPQGNNTFSFNDFLALADREMRTGVAPRIANCRENYWMTTTNYDVSSDNKYPIPHLALGQSVVDMKVLTGTNYIHLARIEVSDLYSTNYTTAPAYCYWIEDQNLRIIPSSLAGTRVMWYYRIPSQLVATSACGQITAISGNTVTVSSLPSAFVGGGELDIVGQQPGFNVLLKDDEPISIIGNDILFDSVPSQVSVGDWVCLSGQSCVVQCPLEWIEVLVQRVACAIYEIQGYTTKLKVAKETLAMMMASATDLVSPRTIESEKFIFSGGSLLYPQNMGWKTPVRSS